MRLDQTLSARLEPPERVARNLDHMDRRFSATVAENGSPIVAGLDSRFELFIRHGSQAVWPFFAFFFMTLVDFSPSYEFCSLYAMDNQRLEGNCGYARNAAEWSDELVEDLIGFAHTHF